MQINYVISPYPSLALNMVAKAYETQASTAEVANIVIPAPHIAPATVNFTGLDKIPHTIRLFTSAGTLLHEFTLQPTENVVTVFTPIFFKIGDGGANTPAIGDVFYINAALAGKNNTNVEVFSNGMLRYPGIHYDTDLSGGFHLLQAGDIFEADTEWMVQQLPDVVANPVNDSVVAKIVGGFIDVVNTNRNYSPVDLRKLVRLSGATGSYTFASGVAVPIGYSHTFTNFATYASLNDIPIISFLNAPLLQGNTPVNLYPLPYGSVATFTFDGTNWNLVSYANTQAGVYAKIVHLGRFQVGDVASQLVVNITIPTQPDTDYWVCFNLYCQSANIDLDNDVIAVVAFQYTYQFSVMLREIQGNIQNLRIDYAILRRN